MGIATELAREIASKIEVLKDLEEPVRELIEPHERQRDLRFPTDILAPQPESSPDEYTRK
jgi:acyl-[acyl-carrier-protein] desaturase